VISVHVSPPSTLLCIELPSPPLSSEYGVRRTRQKLA
jgi:hypothetical protein